MSTGISRSRLMEERKQWRKDHPHVNLTTLTDLYQETLRLYLSLGFLGSTWKESRQFTRLNELDLWYSRQRQCNANISYHNFELFN